MSRLGPFILVCGIVLIAGVGLERMAAGPRTPLRSAAVVRRESPAPSVPVNVYAATAQALPRTAVRNTPARVYVPNSLANTVDVIDPMAFTVVARFPVGRVPHHITPSWDLRELYVDDTGSGTLTVIDPRSGRPVRTITVPDPYNLYFTPDGTRAIVVAEARSRLDVRDPQTWALIGRIPIPSRGVDHLDFTADGRVLLASTEFSGVVVKVDIARMKVVGTVYVGGLPVDVRLSPDGTVFYVANQGRHGVSIIDPATLREVAFLPTGRGAHGLALSRDTRSLYVSNRLAGTISVIDTASRQVVATWKVSGNPDMMQVSPDGQQLWVSNRFEGTVSVIDTGTGRVLHVIRTGRGAHGLTYFPQPGRYSIGHNGVYR